MIGKSRKGGMGGNATTNITDNFMHCAFDSLLLYLLKLFEWKYALQMANNEDGLIPQTAKMKIAETN